nr:hypothetical protein CFP56_59097 [Quercus suber]
MGSDPRIRDMLSTFFESITAEGPFSKTRLVKHIQLLKVHQDPFLSTLAEIGEGFSKLNARSAANNEVTRKQHLSHAINKELEAARVSNEEVEAARVCHAQGFGTKIPKNCFTNEGSVDSNRKSVDAPPPPYQDKKKLERCKAYQEDKISSATIPETKRQ